MTTASKILEEQQQNPSLPPRIVPLPAWAFADTWDNRPSVVLNIGLRRISADELLAASIKGKNRAAEIFPSLPPHDPYRLEVADIVTFHDILGKALCDPRDVRKPLWRDQQELSGENMLPRGPTGSVVPLRFTRDGLGRLFDELEVLNIQGNPTWAEATDEEMENFAQSILDGSFIEDLGEVVDPCSSEEEHMQARDAFESDLRRFVKHLIELRKNGPKTVMGAM